MYVIGVKGINKNEPLMFTSVANSYMYFTTYKDVRAYIDVEYENILTDFNGYNRYDLVIIELSKHNVDELIRDNYKGYAYDTAPDKDEMYYDALALVENPYNTIEAFNKKIDDIVYRVGERFKHILVG